MQEWTESRLLKASVPLGTFDQLRCAGFQKGKIEFAQPANGTLATQQRLLVHVRGACKDKKLKLTLLHYKPKPGFRDTERGSATYGASGFTDSGNDRKIDVITVTVE